MEFEQPDHFEEIHPIEEKPKSPIGRFIDKAWKIALTVIVIFMLIFWVFRI